MEMAMTGRSDNFFYRFVRLDYNPTTKKTGRDDPEPGSRSGGKLSRRGITRLDKTGNGV